MSGNTRIGAYEVLSPPGAGGMGPVSTHPHGAAPASVE
jgi:hypothetical protein